MIRAEVKGSDGKVKQEVIRNRDNVDGVYDEILLLDPVDPDAVPKVYIIKSSGPTIIEV